ncbi:hypothetical protein ABGT17_22880 [Rossellomorea marisflavi]
MTPKDNLSDYTFSYKMETLKKKINRENARKPLSIISTSDLATETIGCDREAEVTLLEAFEKLKHFGISLTRAHWAASLLFYKCSRHRSLLTCE